MQSTASFLIAVLGYLTFGIWAIIWISKKKKAGEKISLLAKIVIAIVFLSSSSVLISFIELPPMPETPETNIPMVSTMYYVKSKSANVRECPSISCKVIDSLLQNTSLTFPGNLFDKYPDWAEITFPNGEKGYVSKTTLSENTVPESQLTPTDDSSSVGGITIGPWGNIQMTLGDSYEFPFCEPPSAISGATCGALADTTTDPKGGTPPYSFVKKSGFLPPGITLELNGTLKGTPTQEGTYNFRLCAKDLYGGEGCQNLAVVVKKKDNGVTIEQSKSEEPLADTPLDLTINGGTCRLTKNVFDDDGKVVARYFTVEFMGTAAGPIYTSIGYQSQRTMYEQAEPDSWKKFEAPSWTPSYGTAERETGNPSVTTWKLTLNNGYSASQANYYRIWVVVRGGSGDPIEKELRVDCP